MNLMDKSFFASFFSKKEVCFFEKKKQKTSDKFCSLR